ncbi:hypothetical protein F4775DRAFT_545109 [Biscogniauxia sp. FL1348]|nr:hypothetical protein F4775DRAFT_545109 [Biscogniauxia sp. FL1348]
MASASNSLMGFSVHQPAIGARLQFFPAMGSQQLDEMINAYVPGNASILDKRAAVTMEFFEHTMATGELFKFFMVYPYLGSTAVSPASSSTMQDSGYGSSFNTSPVMSENQSTQMSKAPSPSSSSHKARTSSARKAVATPADFSNIPGMKIMTKDGRDVTNSASRGCKTKEQRDHAHLMRIIKACEACRKKKIRCDPSHKRRVAGASEAKVVKKAKVARPAAAPPQKTVEVSPASSISVIPDSELVFESLFTELNATGSVPMEWDQFIQYDEEPTDTVPYDYDFFSDPAGYFSPATSATNTSFTSPFQPITPILPDTSNTGVTRAIADTDEAATLPYLNPGGLEGGSNYVDFNLYSPASSISLDDDPSLINEVTALPGLDRSAYFSTRQQVDCYRDRQPSPDREHSVYRPAMQAGSDVLDWSSSSQGEVISNYDHYDQHDQSDLRPTSSQHPVNGYSSPGGNSRTDPQDLGYDRVRNSSLAQTTPDVFQSGSSGGYALDLPSISRIGSSGSRSNPDHQHPTFGQNVIPSLMRISSPSASGDQHDHPEIQSKVRSIYDIQTPVEAIGDNSSSHGSTGKLSIGGPTDDTPMIRTTSPQNGPDDKRHKTVSLGSQIDKDSALDPITSGGSRPIPPLSSPDRPPVLNSVFSSMASSNGVFMSADTSNTTLTSATLVTTGAPRSTSLSEPKQIIPHAATSWSGAELVNRVSRSSSGVYDVARIALDSAFGRESTTICTSVMQTLVQLQASSGLNKILVAAGICSLLYALYALSVSEWPRLHNSSLGTLPILVVAAYFKLLQHSAPSADMIVSAQPLPLPRQPFVSITESAKRRYVSLQSGVSASIRRNIEKGFMSRPCSQQLLFTLTRCGCICI